MNAETLLKVLLILLAVSSVLGAALTVILLIQHAVLEIPIATRFLEKSRLGKTIVAFAREHSDSPSVS